MPYAQFAIKVFAVMRAKLACRTVCQDFLCFNSALEACIAQYAKHCFRIGCVNVRHVVEVWFCGIKIYISTCSLQLEWLLGLLL